MRLGIYKGGEVVGGVVPTPMVNIVAAHHARNIDGANWLLARGCDYHHRLNWNLDLELGEAALLLPELAAINFSIGVQVVSEPSEHYVTEAPDMVAIIRQESFVPVVTSPHDNYIGAEVHDYTDAELRNYLIAKGGQRTRLYYGQYTNLTGGVKGLVDWGTESNHIVHIAINSTTSYGSITPQEISDKTRAFYEWWTPQNRSDLIYAHINNSPADLSDRVVGLMAAAIVGARQASPNGLDCLMIRTHDINTGGALDCNQAVIDAITEIRGWLQ